MDSSGSSNASTTTFLFTSESVGEGHPDKICDQVSDAILDACLTQDSNAKVAIEVAAKSDMIILLGEISGNVCVDYERITRSAVEYIGYDDEVKGFDHSTCKVLVCIDHQSPDIAQGLLINSDCSENIGAGDQGLMFGYATNETPECMPLTLILAHKLVQKLAELRRTGELPWLRPDCKSQVTIEYLLRNGETIPLRVHTVVISTQHADHVNLTEMRSALLEKVVSEVIPKNLIDEKTVYHLQPTGKFVIGGPQGDAGVTGRKIIVDTYGGWGAHGGGAFSGKDWSKVDRSAAYAARWVAKSLVAAKLCKRCLIQVSYAIGISKPLAISIDTYGTGTKSNAELLDIVNKNFDLRPGMIVRELNLDRPIYFKTACYGHFGREEFSWEQPKELIL